MTNFVVKYNFMDLLKDKGFVPQADMNSFKIGDIFNRLANHLPLRIELPVEPHDFMDLLRDKGFVPQAEMNSFKIGDIFNRLANRLPLRIELPVEPHDFMDLLRDKGFVPKPSNDNALHIRVA